MSKYRIHNVQDTEAIPETFSRYMNEEIPLNHLVRVSSSWVSSSSRRRLHYQILYVFFCRPPWDQMEGLRQSQFPRVIRG